MQGEHGLHHPPLLSYCSSKLHYPPNSDASVRVSESQTGTLGPSTMAPTRSTLIIKFDPEFSCLLSAESPTPIHIFALLTQPLSGTCHTLDTLAAKTRHADRTKESSTSAKNNIQSRVFAADVTVTAAEPTDSANGGAASIAAAAAMPQQACLKYAMGVEEVAALRCEGILYSRELAALADVAVPKTYGFFTGGTAAAPVACLVMDLCVSTEVLRSANEFWCVLLPTTLALACNSDCVCLVDVCVGCVCTVAWRC